MSLEAVHAGLIWTAVVLIVAVLAYHFIYEYPYRRYAPRHPKRMNKFSSSQRMPQYKDNRVISIAMIVCCWILPIPIIDYSINVGYALSGHLGIAGILKTVVDFICVAILIYCSFYIKHRGYRINCLLIRLYSAFLLFYGLYVGYNVITAYYEFYRLKNVLN